MLRRAHWQTCRLAYNSSLNLFHTSAALLKVSETRLRSRALKKANLEKRAQRTQFEEENKASVILGTRRGGEKIWTESLLAKVLLDDSLFSQPFTAPSMVEEYQGVVIPKYRSFGVHRDEKKILFDHLVTLTNTSVPKQAAESKAAAENFARAIDLRNADAAGISYENRRRIIKAFSTPENPFDPGRTEVQAAILTYRIRKLYEHLKRCKHDLQNKLSLRKLVHRRAKVLRYLKRTQRPRYDTLLNDLGLEPESVEGELIVN
ncbi:hypothetical protein MIND_01018500 [Mycena indigotica]|uniref:Mitochondrial ribosomal protein S15 n=1 Tax=Mycena indigotica TaxID=2126181 RepID=A0A8H6S8H5_9AGAR|nr:uncharacterized protein MIND_01018500 [Mycena indigotica]KAF7294808.1 hypothetical protein MIND_01018500 [Mycena indigotica]